MPLSQSPLHEKHLSAGARMTDFAGWTMPVQYTGILDEHRAVRSSCGVFDISHMGEFFVRGPGASSWLDSLLTNRASSLETGKAHYSLLLNERGGVIDDLYVYRIRELEYLLIVNASKVDEDARWMHDRLKGEVTFENLSSHYAAMAVQGPQSPGIFRTCFGRDLPETRNCVVEFPRGGGELWVATTGYTGEKGFEVVCPAEEGPGLWEALLAAGCIPCGLGARDVLRLEMGYPLNGSDLSPDRTPLEAGLGYFVDLQKEDFIGREALLAQKAEGIPTRLAGLVVEGKSPPIRSHYPIWHGGSIVAETTSGGLSPMLGTAIAMAYLPTALSAPGTCLEIDVRGRHYPATVTKKPFIKKIPQAS